MDLVPTTPAAGTPAGFSLSDPFTPAMAASNGIGRADLERMLRAGQVVRLVRGVYVEDQVPLSTMLRARGLALVVGRRQIVIDRTAAWVHGAAALRPRPGDPIPVDVHGRRPRTTGPIPFEPGDLRVVGGVRCTSAVRTALDVGRHLAPERALPLIDGMLRAGSLTHAEIVAASSRSTVHPGLAQLQDLIAMADGRAEEVAESVLRLRWYDARLPTPIPAIWVAGVRLALGLRTHRFAATLSGQLAPEQVARCAAAGWQVLVLDGERVLASDPVHVSGHLEREFHQHLLSQVS